MSDGAFLEWCRVHTEFLYTMLYEGDFIFFDLWSLVHFGTGMVVFMLIASLNFRHKWRWFLFFILLYEIAEVAFIYFAFNFFRPERYNDLILDIIVGVVAAFLSYYLLLYRSDARKTVYLPAWLIMLFSSLTFAFVWVGNYQYQYNFAFLNTKGLNIGAFGLWTIGGFIFLLFYETIIRREESFLKRIFFGWIVYFVLLLATEYTGYYLMNWHEVSIPGARSLILGLIHGNLAMHVYYVIFPLLIIPFYELFSKWIYRAQRNLAVEKYGHEKA